MKVIKVLINSGENGRISVFGLAIDVLTTAFEEDSWNTVTNVFRILSRYGSIKGGSTDGTLLLDIGQLDINTLG